MSDALLRRAFAALLQHHDALRLRFWREGQGWRQEMAGWDGQVPFERVDLSQLPKGEQGEALRETAERLQRSLNLQDGPIMRAVLFEMGGGEQRLLWVIHHLAVDGVSWRILLEDLRSLYEQLEQQREPRLAPKSGSFKSWAQQLQEYAGSEALTAQSDYWSIAAGRIAGASAFGSSRGGSEFRHGWGGQDAVERAGPGAATASA